MKFTFNAQLPTLDVNKIKAQIDQELSDLLIEAATAWIEAGAFKVPVWSGAARSTFHDLASRLNFTLAISPTANAPDRTALGRGAGSGDLKIDKKRGTYGFEYSTTLDHLIENETGTSNLPGLKTPTPYNFRLAALRAWEEVAKKSNLPGFRIKATGKVFS